jgi:hypothetical protein
MEEETKETALGIILGKLKGRNEAMGKVTIAIREKINKIKQSPIEENKILNPDSEAESIDIVGDIESELTYQCLIISELEKIYNHLQTII